MIKDTINIFIAFTIFLMASPTVLGQTSPLSNPSACGLNLALPDENCLPDYTIYQPELFEIEVTNAPGSALGTDTYLKEVQLIVGHTWLNDLRIVLTSPSGIEVELAANNGGGDDNFGNPNDITCMATTTFDAASCVPLTDGIAPFANQSYQPNEHFYMFNDGSNPNQNWTLSICDDTEGDVGTLEYINLVFAPISCLPITDIIIDNIDTTSVTLSWLPSDFCGTTIIEYGPSNFQPGSTNTALGGTVQIANCHPATITGLLPDTDYDVYIRRYCDATGTYSSNSCPTSFHSGCQPPTLTETTHFDLDILCVPQCNIPCALNGTWRNVDNDDTEWTVYNTNTPTPNTGPTTDASGNGNFIYLETSNCDDDSEAHLYSSCIILDKEGTDSCHISFEYHMFGTGVNEMRFEVSTDGGFVWDTLWHKQGNQGTAWHKVYVGLGDYADGDHLMMRFAGKKGSNPKGDIALDEISIYGSVITDFPMFTHYRDEDLDGYGTDQEYVISCGDVSPTGYVLQAGDCNDINPIINPGQAEIPCNSIDENCNAHLTDDDGILPAVVATGDTICSGEQATICAFPVEGNNTLWYDAPDGNTVIGFGNCFSPMIPINNTPIPQVYHFYASQTLDFTCFSDQLTEVEVIVNPTPIPFLETAPAICPNQAFDLASLPIQDSLQTGGNISFHSTSPIDNSNELPSTIVSPNTTTTYYYAITNANGCIAENSVELTVKPGPMLMFSPSDSVQICKENTLDISVTASGGDGNYSYIWNTGSTTNTTTIAANENNNITDLYFVTVTDGEGCFSTDTVSVRTTNSIDAIEVSIQNVSSCTGTDGQITLTASNGTPPFSATWYDTQDNTGSIASNTNTLVLDNIPQGVYALDIMASSDQMCSFPLRNVVVQGPNAIINPSSIQDLSCADSNDGEICMNIIGQASLLWSTGDTTNCINNLSAGEYSITITSGECTTVIDPIIVSQPQALAQQIHTTDIACYGDNSGSISLTTFGGTPPYNYSWDNTQITPSLQHLVTGSYLVTVTDFNNCTLTDSIHLSSPPPIGVNMDQVQHISCAGETDGYIQLGIIGGTPPYQYTWEDDVTTPVRYNLSAGDYTLSVTDYNMCTQTEVITIVEPTPLTLSIASIQQPNCIGNANGSIDFSTTGGTPPYTIHSNIGTTTSTTLNDLAVGDYFFLLTDQNDCQSDTLFMTLEALVPLDLVITTQAPACIGPATGSITLAPQGSPPYSFLWAQGDTTPSIDNLIADSYPVQITDGQGCVYDTTITLSAPQVFDLNLLPTPPSCFGVEDGSIDLVFSSTGTPEFSYYWSDGNNDNERSNLAPGDYNLTIIDALGCSYISDSVSLSSPNPLRLDVEAVGEILCYGQDDAYVEMSIIGGTPPYDISWVGTGVTHEDISNLSAGSYQLQVFDSRFCGLDTTFVFHNPDTLTIDYQIIQGDVCTAIQQDSIIAQGIGGTPPYQYLWSTGTTGHILTDVSPGNYALTITDANNCLATVNNIKLLDRLAPIQLDNFYLSELLCHGDQEVEMTATVSQGTGVYYYSFSPTHLFGPTTIDSMSVVIPVLSPQYSVTVVDVNTGCTAESPTLYANEPNALTIQKDSTQLVSCYNGNDGEIFISINGGTMPYDYQWADAQGNPIATTQDIQNLAADYYYLTITDANNCVSTFVDSSIIEMPTPIEIISSHITDAKCHGEPTGSIDISVDGGQSPYTFLWNNSLQNEDIALLYAGDYQVTITDALNCEVYSTTYTIEEPATSIAIIDTTYHPLCHGSQDGSIIIDVQGGVPPYSYTWIRNQQIIPNEQMPTINNLTAGQYLAEIIDDAGCVHNYSSVLTAPDSLTVDINVSPSPGAYFDGYLSALPNGGTTPYYYQWSTDETSPSITYIANQEYFLTVTDANDCEIMEHVLIVANNTTLDNDNYTFKYWPNPTQTTLFFDIELPKAQNININITNLLGQSVYTNHQYTQQWNSQIPTYNWSNGVYLLELTIDNQRVQAQKIIVQHD